MKRLLLTITMITLLVGAVNVPTGTAMQTEEPFGISFDISLGSTDDEVIFSTFFSNPVDRARMYKVFIVCRDSCGGATVLDPIEVTVGAAQNVTLNTPFKLADLCRNEFGASASVTVEPNIGTSGCTFKYLGSAADAIALPD